MTGLEPSRQPSSTHRARLRLDEGCRGAAIHPRGQSPRLRRPVTDKKPRTRAGISAIPDFVMSRAVRRAGTADATAGQGRRRRTSGPALVRRRERPVRAALNPYRNSSQDLGRHFGRQLWPTLGRHLVGILAGFAGIVAGPIAAALSGGSAR